MKKFLIFLMMVMMLGCGKDKDIDEEKFKEEVIMESEDNKEESKEDEIKEEKYLNIIEVSTVSTGKKSIEIRFSEDLELAGDINGYVKLNSELPYTLVKIKNKVIITGDFNIGDTYEIEVRKGLKSKNGLELKENYKTIVSFKDLEPKISFSNEGIILPGVNEKRISFRTVNVTKVKVTLKKIYENNTTQFLQELRFKGNGNVFNYSMQGEFYKIGDTILEKEYSLESIKNKWIQSEIDLGNLVDKKGFYIVELSFDETGIDYKFPDDVEDWKKYNYFDENGRVGKVIILSDNAMVAQKTKDGIIVNLINIPDNSLVKGAKIKAISKNNQLLEEKITDENGEVTFNNNDKLFYLISENGEEKSILKFDDSQLSYDGFAVDGVFNENGVKGFLYTDRGIYRPGDKIYFSVIARSDKKSFPEGQPIKVDMYTPRGQKFIENKIVKDSKNGFYTFELETNQDSETGLWTVVVELGGDRFEKNIPIETIVPYKIKVETEVPKEIDISQEKDLKYSIKSDYLFGAPADGLKYNSELEVLEKETNFEKYKNYIFRDPTTYSFYYRDLKNGVLDENGKVEVIFNLKEILSANTNLVGNITTKVLETGGRPVINRESISIKKYDTYIGIENPESRYIKSGDKLNLKVISVTDDGEKLVAGRKLKYRIYKNEYSWWWDYNDYGSFLKSIKTDSNTTLIAEKEFISLDKPYLLDCEINGSGEIFVEVEDIATGQKTGLNLYASSWMDSSIAKKIDSLKIKTDKKTYNIGEKATVYYEGIEGAKALITVEKSGKILKRYWKDVNGIENIEEIEITKEMFPNSYVTIALFQNYENYSNDRPLRLYGAVPLMVKDESSKLDIEITAPNEIKPNETFKINIKNKANSKMDYTVAVVDEGLLDITNFKTPDPWQYFYQKEALQISTFDNYNEIIGKTFGEVHQVLKVGGGDFIEESFRLNATKARNKQLGLEEAKRFKPVAMFKGVVSTDENGDGEIEFTMPNYLGSVKVMVVGADSEKYGSTEKEILVKAPIVLNSSIPRTLKVGDEIVIPVEVFALEDSVENAVITLEFNGKKQKEEVKFENIKKVVVYFKIQVPNKIGKENIKISVESSKYEYEEKTEIDINSNSPYIYLNKIKNIKNEEMFNAPEDFIKGSVNSKLTISTSPILAIDQRLKELIRYPYGCVEQTTSTVFPQLFISKLSSEKVYDMKKITENINSGLARLSRFQLFDGSFTYWQGDNEAELWATSYVGHFLINAKDKGYYIPNDMYEKWLKFTRQDVKDYNREVNLKAYNLYLLALAGESEISEMNLVYENYLDQLTLPSKWYLAAAYKLAGDEKMSREIADKLSTDLNEKSENYYTVGYGSVIKDKAIILSAYYTIYGKMEEKLYNDILKVLQSKEWLSTQSAAYSLLTLAEIKEDKEKNELKVILEINNKIRKYISTDKEYVEIFTEDVKNIKVKSNNGKEIYVNYYWEGILVNYEGETFSKNLKLERHYYDLNGKEQSEEFIKSIPSGQSFWLEVRVLDDAKESFYIDNIALTQIIPTGWEIENLRALNQKHPKWVLEKIEDTYIDYEDIRDDRVMWFFDYDSYRDLGKRFFIKINSVTKGKYKLPGTRAEAMYDINYEAYLKGTEVEVK